MGKIPRGFLTLAFSAALAAPQARAGIADSPLPVLSAGATTLHLFSVVSNLQLKYACRQLHGIRITQLKGLPEARGIVEAIREKLRAHRAP